MPNGARFKLRSAVIALLATALLLGSLPRSVLAQRTTPPSEPTVTITPYLLDNGEQQPVMAEWVRLTAEENRRTGSDQAVETAFLRYRTRAAEPQTPIVILSDSPLSELDPLDVSARASCR